MFLSQDEGGMRSFGGLVGSLAKMESSPLLSSYQSREIGNSKWLTYTYIIVFEVGKSSAIDGISSEPRKAKTSSFTRIWLEQR